MATGETPLDLLSRAVTTNRALEPSWAGAIRLRVRLQPAGGPGAKTMPPTYAAVEKNQPPIYIDETRVIEGEKRFCVSLDGAGSQAKRMGLALADEVALGNAHVPTIWVNQEEFGRHSAFEFSHRAFDAWVEDAVLDGERFGRTDQWARLARSKRRDLTLLLLHSPVSILLGGWAARLKSPQGAARLARILASEIIAVDAKEGRQAKGKRDIHDVSRALKAYKPADGSRERIVLDPDLAARGSDGQPVLFEKDGRPSKAGYGAVTPTLADLGGITMDHALQIATISLPAIRECRFPDGERDDERDTAGRMMLVTLGLRLLTLQVERGYDLRSGCLLIPEEEPEFELIDRLGKAAAAWPVMELDTAALLEAAKEQGASYGLDWEGGDIQLEAGEVQLELLRRSLAGATATAE
jgi:CRISPR-associated protein Csb1